MMIGTSVLGEKTMNKDQPDFQPQQYDPYEDEIELMDYLKVLWEISHPPGDSGLRGDRGHRQLQHDRNIQC